jgi:hypothetical protein
MNWLKMFCDTANIEASSRGNVKRCRSLSYARGERNETAAWLAAGVGLDAPAERVAAAAAAAVAEAGTCPAPGSCAADARVEVYCFGAGHSNWSNTPLALWRRWFVTEPHWLPARAGSRQDNGMWEVWGMGWWSWTPMPYLAQLRPGLFLHREIDK